MLSNSERIHIAVKWKKKSKRGSKHSVHLCTVKLKFAVYLCKEKTAWTLENAYQNGKQIHFNLYKNQGYRYEQLQKYFNFHFTSYQYMIVELLKMAAWKSFVYKNSVEEYTIYKRYISAEKHEKFEIHTSITNCLTN